MLTWSVRSPACVRSLLAQSFAVKIRAKRDDVLKGLEADIASIQSTEEEASTKARAASLRQMRDFLLKIQVLDSYEGE